MNPHFSDPGPALLTHLLLPSLSASGDGRVVHASCPATDALSGSLEETLKHLDFYDASSTASCDPFERYAYAKRMLQPAGPRAGAFFGT